MAMSPRSVGDRSIRQQLLWLVVTVTSLALALLLLGIGAFSALSNRQNLVQRTSVEAKIIAENSASALAFDDDEFAERVLQSLSVEPEVVEACLFDSDGKVFSTYSPAKNEPATCPEPTPLRQYFDGSFLVSVHEVRYAGDVVGWLYLKSTTTALSNLLLQYAAVAAIAAAAALGAAVLLSARLQRRVSVPLESLIKAANSVREEANYAARAPKLRDDELGRLTDTFNAMLDHIEHADAELRTSHQRYRDLFNTPLVGIFSVDSGTGRANEANIAAALLLGYSDVVALEESFSLERHFPDLAKGGSVFRDLVQHGEVHGLELRYLPLSGEERWAVFSGRYLGSTDTLEGTIADVSEKKQAERNVRALEKHVRHQQKLESIGTLASGVAHEINNPIQAIMGQAELLSLEPGIGDNVRSATTTIIEESERIARIVGSLLTFARKEPEQRKRELVKPIIEQTVGLVSSIMRKDGIKVRVDYLQPDLAIVCDRQQIQQVLMNLLTNGRDALNARYPEVSPEKVIHVALTTTMFEGAEWVRISVEDFGTGMPASVRERVFDPFFTTKRTKGTGLGLSIGFGIVADHGGRLSVESEEGNFTRFHVDFRPA